MVMKIQPISFQSTYTVDTGTAQSKSQIFTLGAMMNGFWINSPRATFDRIRNTAVYGTVDINVKNQKDKAFEAIMQRNGISYKKKELDIKA